MPKPRSSVANGTSSKQDIRSFFLPKQQKNKPPPPVDLSDDDVIPESPDVQVKIKKRDKKKKRVLNDSSDEEIFTKKAKKSEESSKGNSKKTEKPALKEVKVVDLFGSGPIKRTEPIVKKEKKLKTETGIHSDEEFEKSLLELDGVEKSELSNVVNSHEKEPNIQSISENKDIPEKKDKSILDKKAKSILENKYKTSNSTKLKDKVEETNKSKYFNGDSISKSPEKSKNHEQNKHDSKEETRSKSKDSYKMPTEAKHLKPVKDSTHSSGANSVSKEKRKDETPNKKPHKSPEKRNQIKSETKKSKIKESSSNLYTMEVVKNEKKRDFSVFIEDEDDEKHSSGSKKKKPNTSLNSSVIVDEEKNEKKRHSAILYQNYMNRSGPKNLGAKEMPEGTPDCLKDCAFLLTGVLESFEREEVAEAIAKFEGTVKNGISKKVTHVVAGDDAGPAKLAKAKDLGIPIMNEDEFLQLIKDRSAKKLKSTENKKPNTSKPSEIKNNNSESHSEDKKDKDKIKQNHSADKSDTGNSESKSKTSKLSPDQMKSFEEKIKKSFYSKAKKDKNDGDGDSVDVIMESASSKESVRSAVEEPKRDSSSVSLSAQPGSGNMMWVEKYKPQSVKQIIGQHGDCSNVKKLSNWLSKWYVSRKAKIPKPSPWAKKDDGAYFKAALLSGPPGVGKTTTVSLVCKELGFDTVELNASDTRNKTLIREQIRELLNTNSLAGYAKGDTGKMAVTKKHVLVMDEVDGMAGNEDRGGLQELIGLIKTTSVPIICMCNDRQSEKMRSLVNYCYDLKFSRPRVDQIKSAMLSVCFKEGIKVPPDVLTQLIIASNQDVRQTLNSLSMWAADPDNMNPEKLKKDAQNTKKDLKLGSWEAVRKVFSAEDHKTMSVNDKSDLFFYDYSIAPLFVQENYVSVMPHCPKDEILHRLSQAADSISCGDLVDARIRGSQAWSLLPLQAMYASVIPGSRMSGHVAGQIQFPTWLGNNSRHNKMKRLACEIHAHTRLSATGSKSSIFLDYSKHLRDAIVTPLIKERTDGIDRSLEVLQAYNLLREDLDSLNTLALWPRQQDPMILIDSKVKAAMTRAYNKSAPALPHATGSFSKGRGRGGESQGSEEYGDTEEFAEDEPSQQDDDPEHDALIKVKKKTGSAKSSDSEKPGTSKGDKGKKGKGKK